MKKTLIIAVCTLLAAALGAAATVAYLTFLRAPADAPAQACADGRPESGGPVVVAAGASMTRGTLGRDWVGDLRARPGFGDHRFVNAGVNGDTSAGLRARTGRDIVACDPDLVTVLVGANDVRDGVPLQQYRDNIAAIVDRVTGQTSARVALMSLPPLGEDLDAGVNHALRGYNAALKQVAADTGAGYVPVNERFTGHLRGTGPRPSYDFGFGTAYLAAARHHLLRQSWDEVARAGGLELYVDHLHLSDRGGAMVTDLAARWLSAAGDQTGARP